MYLTNTGPTKLTFNLIQNNSSDQLISRLILQPGEFKSLDINNAVGKKSQTLQVLNNHPQTEGTFIILVKDGKLRFSGWN